MLRALLIAVEAVKTAKTVRSGQRGVCVMRLINDERTALRPAANQFQLMKSTALTWPKAGAGEGRAAAKGDSHIERNRETASERER